MPRYLIEVPYENKKASCNLVVNVFKSTGSHFLTNTDFGSPDGVHKAWITISVDSRREALYVVPPPFRDKAKVIRVRKFVLEKVNKTLKPHHKK